MPSRQFGWRILAFRALKGYMFVILDHERKYIMPTQRITFSKKLLDRLSKSVPENGRDDFSDPDNYPGLIFRVQPSGSVWLARGRAGRRKVGSYPQCPLSEAYAISREIGDELKEAKPTGSGLSWTFRELVERYISEKVSAPRFINGRKTKPSDATMKEARRVLERKALHPFYYRAITKLSRSEVVEARNQIAEVHGYNQANKSVDYVRMAFKWAYQNHYHECGLEACDVLWWENLPKFAKTGKVAEQMAQNSRSFKNAKFALDHLVEALFIHEEYCQNRRVSAGVRFGFWWIAFTAARRGAALELERRYVFRKSWDFLPEGWSVVQWDADVMKGRRAFALPIPPEVDDMLKMAEYDSEQEARRRLKDGSVHSPWVFLSARKNKQGDPLCATGETAVSQQIERLRGNRGGENLVKHLPHFSLHTIRGLVTTSLGENYILPPGAASAVLDHRLPGDKAENVEQISAITEQRYSAAHRLALKKSAMEYWCRLLLSRYIERYGHNPWL